MKYTLEKIINRFDSGENLKYVFFWGHSRKRKEIDKSCFSQWFDSPFLVEGVTYRTSEHWMMAKKALLFGDTETFKRVINCEKPGEAKELGRQVIRFENQVWEENRLDIVIQGNFHKFSQSPELSEFLKNTKERILVEASPLDTIWGIGLAQDNEDIENPYYWNGQNLLGFALMEVRDILNKIGEFRPLENLHLPPWLKYPEIDRYSIGWRMGKGEDYLLRLSNYLNNLKESERLIYEMTFPAPKEWKNWYRD